MANEDQFQGDIAHGADDQGNPVKMGGRAKDAAPTAVLDGQRVNAYFDTLGRLHVVDESGGGGGGGGGVSSTVAIDQTTPGSTNFVAANITKVGGTAVALGQALMAASFPVALASNQSALPVTAASLPLPTLAATSSLQGTGNTSLSSLDTKTPALGQALAAGSTPVVLTAVQLTILASPTLSAGSAIIGTANIGTDVVAAGTFGGKTVGASAVQMIAASNPATKGVLVKADDSNTGSVYVGLSSSVTADAGGANSGIRLAAGSSLLVPVSNANLVYLIGSAASQNVAWMAC